MRDRRAIGGRGLQVGWAAVLAVLLAGCVVESRYDNGQLVARTVGLGVARLRDCGATSTLVVTSVLGAAVGRDGMTLGYTQAEQACIPHECKAIFWVEDPAVVERVRTLIGSDEQFCIASQERGVER
jgi:hypothetical protein